MRVEDIMTRDVKCCSTTTNLAEVGACMWENDCGALPVVNAEGKLAGVITDRDVCIALATRNAKASDVCAKDVISGKAYYCVPEDDVRSAMKIMQGEKIRRLPVVDEQGFMKGILSVDDVVLAAENAVGKKTPDFTYEYLLKALTASSGHRSERYGQEHPQAEKAAVA